jgi:hypothetical protein
VLSDLVIYQRSLQAKTQVFDHPFRLQVFGIELTALEANRDLSASQKREALGEIIDEWQQLIVLHNTAVSAANDSFTVSDPALNARIAANAARPVLIPITINTIGLDSVAYVDRRDAFELQLSNSSNGVGENVRRLDQAIREANAVSQSGSGGSNLSPDNFDPTNVNIDDFDGAQFDSGTLTTSNQIDDLQVDYQARLASVNARIAELNSEISSRQSQLAACQADPECHNEAALQAEIDTRVAERTTYLALQARYGALITRLGFLSDDLYCRATDNGNCVADAVQLAYLNDIDAKGKALSTPSDDLCGPIPADFDASSATDAEIAAAYAHCDEGNGADQTPPSASITVSATDYPELINLADFCFKLDSLMGRTSTAFTPRLGYQQLNGPNQIAAWVLVEFGNNQRLDPPNRFASNASTVFFAAPDRPHDLNYDDRVRPTTTERLSISLGCPSLLQSYQSLSNTAEEINLLYQVAAGALDSAQQDVITSSITLALAVIRLAVDTAAVIKDTAGGIAATATCVASLGLAVNACISAGFQFSAAAAHGATLVADAAAVAQASVDLRTALADRSSAQATLADTTAHFAEVVAAALNADSRGGLLDAIPLSIN